MKSDTGITITQKGNRIEVESDKLKTVKNAKYRHPINDPFFGLFDYFKPQI